MSSVEKQGRSKVTNSYLQKLLKNRLMLKTFRGVFPCDRIPKTLRNGQSIIVNTDPHYLPGAHYVSFYRSRGKYFYFDSLSLNLGLSFPHLAKSLESSQFKPLFPVLTSPIQHPLSDFCGLFCCSYILSVCPPFSKVEPSELYETNPALLLRNDAVCTANLINCISRKQ